MPVWSVCSELMTFGTGSFAELMSIGMGSFPELEKSSLHSLPRTQSACYTKQNQGRRRSAFTILPLTTSLRSLRLLRRLFRLLLCGRGPQRPPLRRRESGWRPRAAAGCQRRLQRPRTVAAATPGCGRSGTGSGPQLQRPTDSERRRPVRRPAACSALRKALACRAAAAGRWRSAPAAAGAQRVRS